MLTVGQPVHERQNLLKKEATTKNVAESATGIVRAILFVMRTIKALVKDCRLLLDEPTDLREGTVVPLEVADEWDELDDAERALLHDAIREGFEDAKAGRTIGADEWAAALRARL